MTAPDYGSRFEAGQKRAELRADFCFGAALRRPEAEQSGYRVNHYAQRDTLVRCMIDIKGYKNRMTHTSGLPGKIVTVPPAEAQPTLVLLDRVRQGDQAAVNGLLERHREAIKRMINQRMDHHVQRRVDASDIVQDVMIEANRRLIDYLANPIMPFQLWLRSMAKDRLIDAYRRHRVATRRSVDREVSLTVLAGENNSEVDMMSQLADSNLTPAAAATWREFQSRFAAAVEALEDDDRKIVLLRHFEHLSTVEAANALGLTKSAAGMRYLRAMRRLRVLLDDNTAHASELQPNTRGKKI